MSEWSTIRDLLLRPTPAKIDRANLEWYLHCTGSNLSRWLAELDALDSLPHPATQNSEIERWMTQNINSQRSITQYYERLDPVLFEIEKTVLGLKEREYARVIALRSPAHRIVELTGFLTDVYKHSIAMATKYLAPKTTRP